MESISMKKQIQSLEISPQFIIDSTGKKTGVLLDMATFEQLMEKLEELYLGAMAEHVLENEAEFTDFEEVKKKLIACNI